MLRPARRLRPFLAAGVAVFIVVRGDTSVDVPDVRSFAASAAAPATPARSTLVGVGPTRVLDTHTSGPLAPGVPTTIDVVELLGVPAGRIDGLVLSVTVAGASEPTFVSIGAAGEPPAELVPAHTTGAVSAVVTTAVGSDGTLVVTNDAGTADVVVDIAAYVLAP